jgi:hypothetical protein
MFHQKRWNGERSDASPLDRCSVAKWQIKMKIERRKKRSEKSYHFPLWVIGWTRGTFISLSIFERMTTNRVPFLLPHHGLNSRLHYSSVNIYQPVMQMCNFGTFTAVEWAKINYLRPHKDLVSLFWVSKFHRDSSSGARSAQRSTAVKMPTTTYTSVVSGYF